MDDLAALELPLLGRTSYGQGGVGRLTPENEGFWRSAAGGVLAVPTCEACGVQRWPASPTCRACLSLEWSWQPAGTATGTVYTFTWLEHLDPPQPVVIVELERLGEPLRMPAWLVGVDRADLECGLRVHVEFEVVAEGIGVPRWKRVPAS